MTYYEKQGACFCARNAADIENLVRLYHEQDRQLVECLKQAGEWFKKEWIGPLDGKSGERVARCIEKL